MEHTEGHLHFHARSFTEAGRGHVAEVEGTHSVPTSSGQRPAASSATVVFQLMLRSCICTATHHRRASVASLKTTCTCHHSSGTRSWCKPQAPHLRNRPPGVPPQH